MARTLSILKTGSETINQDLSSSFDSWESDALNIGSDNNRGVVTMQFDCTSVTTAAKIKIMQSLDGVGYDYVSDTNGNIIELQLNTSSVSDTTIANVVDLYAGFIKVVGSSAGVGTLNTIKVRVI